MKTDKLLKSLSLKQKIFQMFILGFSGENLSSGNLNIQKAIQTGLGGIILFSENIKSYNQTAKLTQDLQNMASIPVFVSIDHEGGKIERTINIKNKINYLSPGELAVKGNPVSAHIQAETMAKELNSIGVNMNFAPVMDVNTNKKNPIIGIRSFGSDPDTVIEFSKAVYKTFIKNSIIPVAKHFPGHGDTGEDSHLTMPVVDLSFEELENIHIKPFKQAVKDGINAIMVSHVHYTAFENETLPTSHKQELQSLVTPASLSQNILKNYLRGNLKYKGLIISDDMVMGGIKNYYKNYDACVRGINAGIDIFVFRDSSDKTLNIIEKLCAAVKNGDLSEDRINESAQRILQCKEKFLFSSF